MHIWVYPVYKNMYSNDGVNIWKYRDGVDREFF